VSSPRVLVASCRYADSGPRAASSGCRTGRASTVSSGCRRNSNEVTIPKLPAATSDGPEQPEWCTARRRVSVRAGADYAHAVEVCDASRLLFVAGTMGLDSDGAPGKALDEQLGLVWRNIGAILAAAGMTVDNIVRLSTYLRDASYADANAAARVAALNGRVITTTPSWRRLSTVIG
jgi:2-iminobutanoate/2-iminopropanoate deaminase